jgi:hypothetical protein
MPEPPTSSASLAGVHGVYGLHPGRARSSASAPPGCSAPLTGTLFAISPQGGSMIPGVWLDMNSPFPEARELRDDGTTGKPI